MLASACSYPLSLVTENNGNQRQYLELLTTLSNQYKPIHGDVLQSSAAVPMRGHQTSSFRILLARPRPISWRRGDPPKLLTAPTARWISLIPFGFSPSFNQQPDARARAGAVTLRPRQLEIEKATAVTWIVEKRIAVSVPRVKAAQLVVDILIPVVVEVGKADAMALLQMPEASPRWSRLESGLRGRCGA